MTDMSAADGPPDVTKSKSVDRYRTANLLRVGLARLSESSNPARKASNPSFVTLSHDKILVEGPGGAKAHEVGLTDHSDLATALGKLPGKSIALVMTGETGLDLGFKVPNGPIPELRKMVEEEIKYRSPFPEGEIRYAWSAQETDAGDWEISAFVVLRSVIDPFLEKLRAMGVSAHELRRESPKMSLAACPDWLGAPGRRGTKWPRPFILLGFAAALFAVSLIAQMMLGGRSLASLETEAATARSEIAAETQARQQRIAFDAYRSESYRSIWLVGAITEALPDEYWLDQMVIEEGEIVLTGFGPSAAEVTRILSEMTGLQEVRFASPITRDNTQNIERFRIAAEIVEAVNE